MTELYRDPGVEPTAGLAEVREAVLRKAAETAGLRAAVWKAHAPDLVRAAHLLAGAFRAGGKLLAFGNGGSAADAQDLVSDLVEPPVPGWHALPALSLAQEPGIITGLGVELGIEAVFSHQLLSLGGEDDVAVGFSAGPADANLLETFRAARSRGMTTLGFLGGPDGGVGSGLPDDAEPALDVAVTVPSAAVARVQEVHATASHTLLFLVQRIVRGVAGGASGP